MHVLHSLRRLLPVPLVLGLLATAALAAAPADAQAAKRFFVGKDNGYRLIFRVHGQEDSKTTLLIPRSEVDAATGVTWVVLCGRRDPELMMAIVPITGGSRKLWAKSDPLRSVRCNVKRDDQVVARIRVHRYRG